MKFFATLSLAALVAMPASVLAKRPQLKFTPWFEEHCHQAQRISDDETLKQGKCRNFEPFRSYQIVPHKKIEKLHDYCVLEVYPVNDCQGEHNTVPNINTASNVCTPASFPFNSGVDSGRSVMFVCNPPAPAKPVESTTTINIPILPLPVSSTLKVEETKVTAPASPSASTITSVFFEPKLTSVLTSVTLTVSSGKPVVHLGPSKQSTSTQETTTVWVTPTSPSSTSTVWVSPSSSPSTTVTFSFSTAFGKYLPRPTKRAEEAAY